MVVHQFLQKSLVASIVVLLCSCSLLQSKTVVASLPAPPAIERPQLESDSIQQNMEVDELIQAYRISIIRLKDYAKKLESVIESYRK